MQVADLEADVDEVVGEVFGGAFGEGGDEDSLVPGGPYTVTAQADGYEGQSVEQQFGGIGIQVQPDTNSRRILVISPLPDTPA